MKVALIGGTGFVGSAVLKELLDRNHAVVALARHPAKLVANPPKLTVALADVREPEAVQHAVEGCAAVISAYNPGWGNPHIYDEFMQGSRSIVQGVKAAGVQRYLVVGGAGSLYVDGQQLVDSADFPPEIKPGALAARDMYSELQQEQGLDWTLLSPAVGFHPGSPAQALGRTGQYRTGRDAPLMQPNGSPGDISAADLAVALVDALEQRLHVRERFTVAH